MSQTAPLLEQAQSAVEDATALDELDAVRVKYLGRKGLLTAQLDFSFEEAREKLVDE